AVLAAVVGALPPAVAGLAVHMRALIRRESHTSGQQPAPAFAPVEQESAPVEQLSAQVEQPSAPASAVEQPKPTVEQVAAQSRPAVLVPVPASVFTRVNGSGMAR